MFSAKWNIKIFSHSESQFAGVAQINPDDFIHKEKFSEGPFIPFKDGRLSGLYQKDYRQEIIILKLQVQYLPITSVYPMNAFVLGFIDSAWGRAGVHSGSYKGY